MAGNLEVTLSWLDDELLALTNAEKEMGENGIYKSADTTTKKQSETESTAEEVSAVALYFVRWKLLMNHE